MISPQDAGIGFELNSLTVPSTDSILHRLLNPDVLPVQEQATWLLDLDQALERLRAHDERLARIVECRFFAGLSEEETAAALDASVRTVQRGWARARAWLRTDLETGGM